jgi:hypothetical protein
MNSAKRSLHLSWFGGLLLISAWSATGCDGGSEDGNGGGAAMGGAAKGGASGSATGGSGASTSGAPTGGTAGTGGTSKGGTGGSLGGTGGRGGTSGAAGSTTTFIGGCPDPMVCPAMPEDGQVCSAAMTCCVYQMLGADVVGCICTDGLWACAGSACDCI